MEIAARGFVGHGPGWGDVAVQGNTPWGAVPSHGPSKGPLGRPLSRRLLEEEVRRSTLSIDGAVPVGPLTTRLDKGLGRLPGSADGQGVAAPALLKPRHVPRDPPQDRGVAKAMPRPVIL